MENVWEVAPRKFDDLTDQLLYNRGIIQSADEEDKKLDFFDHSFEKDLYDPYLMKNLEKAVILIKEIADTGGKIGIFSDYDADGIPGAALLFRALQKIGIKAQVYIPDREGGYGLSQAGIDYLVKKGCKLIITVDLGIRNFEEAKYCRSINLPLVITDHHLPGDQIPEADLVINPKQPGDKYPFKELCGCGVAYKLVCGLAKLYPRELDEKFLKWNLDLVCISTVCDVVPLSSENRVLVKYGLLVMKKTKNMGLAKLLEISSINPAEINTYHVGFQIGPRINAPGRIDHATKSFELLVTEDEEEAKTLALDLNKQNERRQDAMTLTQQTAIARIEEDSLDQNKIIIVAGDWQKGVIGPSASKLVEKYNRPVILFATDGDHYVGSARSISGVNIVEMFEKNKENIDKFGGHKGAAGLSVAKKNFQKFLDSIIKFANKFVSDDDLTKKIKIDAQISLSEVTKKLYEVVLRLEPYGLGNARPIFLAQNVNFDNFRFVGKESNHLSMLSMDSKNKIKSICFNFPYDKSMIKNNVTYDIVFRIDLDEWQGNSKLSLNIIDLRLHE